MPKSITLLNVDEGTYDNQTIINAASTGIGATDADWSVRMQRLQGGLSDGIDVIWLDNGCTKLALLPTRGMSLWKADVAGTPVEWKSPVDRLVHPAFVDQNRRGGIGWLDGFNELVCRCGLSWHGAPGTDVIKNDAGEVVAEQELTLHGRIANLSAHEVRVEISNDGEISVIGVIDEASMFGGKLQLTAKLTTHIGSNTFEISDTIQNLASSPAEVEMLYHCNFGQPFLGKDSTVHVAAEAVAPHNADAAKDINTWTTYAEPQSGVPEQCFMVKPVSDNDDRAIVTLANAANDKAVAIRFDTTTLPWLTLWKSNQAIEDGYCAGLEPGSSFPNLRSFEREHGRVISLDSMQSSTFELAVSVATDAANTAAFIDEVKCLQAGHELTVHPAPNPEWSNS